MRDRLDGEQFQTPGDHVTTGSHSQFWMIHQ